MTITSDDRFKRALIEVLTKRAANLCSNPSCGAITTGPAVDDAGTVTVGEGAHIYGARPGSARYDPAMSLGERTDITNAIWLCRNCHKLVDSEPQQFPAERLFEWRREHERRVSESLGKADEKLRQKVIAHQLKEFESETYLAQQIVIDKPYAWEYRLLAELLRAKIVPILVRWRSLERGLYAMPLTRIPRSDSIDWIQDRIGEIGEQIPALSTIMNEEIQQAWGAPGEPGSATEILATCNLFTEACRQLLVWEERVRFARLSDDFEALRQLLAGVGGRALTQVAAIPASLGKIFESEIEPMGTHAISVVVDFPDGWVERFAAELERHRRS